MKITQALPKLVTFDEFVAWYPENIGVRYELKCRFFVGGLPMAVVNFSTLDIKRIDVGAIAHFQAAQSLCSNSAC